MSVIKIDPEKVQDNPYQPRSHYPPKTIGEIAYSIEQIGIIHIPTGRQVNDHYELAEGHLRKRAYIKLKKKDPKKFGEMPLDVKQISDRDMAIIALEENLRRQDITPLDQARAVDMYLVNFTDVTETALAKTLNMTQGNVSNMRRVLKCPKEVLQKIVDGKINFTMARELLIFQGINLGKKQHSYGGQGDKERDEKWLMLDAVKGVGGQYGPAATVDGIKKAIYGTCRDNMRHLEKGGSYYGSENEPLFDTRAADCLKCPKMVRANETKSTVKHFCSDTACWDKKQEAHKKKMAAQAVKKRDAELSQRLRETEEKPPAPEDVVDEMELKEDPLEDSNAVDEEEQENLAIAAAPKFATFEDVCKGCIGQKDCQKGGRRSIADADGPEEHQYYCLDRVTKDNYQEIREKAKAVVPDSIKDMVKNNAGTRAEVIDIREIRLNNYGDDMKAGFALLDAHIYDGWRDSANKVMDRIDDPAECLERCTKGFHYAYDSSKNDADVRYMCSMPSCLSKKKAAFTRSVNAKGQAKKKAELKAIQEAVEQTVTIDKPRLLLIMEAQFEGNHASRGYGTDTPLDWMLKRLKIEAKSQDNIGRRKLVIDKFSTLPEDKLQRLLVEFCLISLCYEGDIKSYKIQTTEKLNRMGVGIQVEKK